MALVAYNQPINHNVPIDSIHQEELSLRHARENIYNSLCALWVGWIYCEIKEELKILYYLLEHDDHRLGLGTSTIVVLMIRGSIIWLMEDTPFIF